jgi:hypothetical protein
MDIGGGVLVIDMTNDEGREEYNRLAGRRSGNKYNARKTIIDGITFDSQAEGRRYGELKYQLQAGQIEYLQVHPLYALEVNGVKIADYEADFRYCQRTPPFGWVVEDVKSKPTITAAFRLKQKLMKAIYGIEVEIVAA